MTVQAQSPGAEIFREEGIASWYGREYDGRLTASGEIFNSTQFTAAHLTLDFGTLVNVTNTFNGKQVTVRINDRGPNIPARIIDLSRAAAEVLDMLTTGTAMVIIESVSAVPVNSVAQAAVPLNSAVPTTPAMPVNSVAQAETPAIQASVETVAVTPVFTPAITPAPERQEMAVIIGGIPEAGTQKHYRLQLGTYRIPRNAVDAFEKLEQAGLKPAYERFEDMYRVVLPGLMPEDIISTAEKIYLLGFTEALIREES